MRPRPLLMFTCRASSMSSTFSNSGIGSGARSAGGTGGRRRGRRRGTWDVDETLQSSAICFFFIPYLEFRWNIIELMWLVFKLEWLENMSQSAHCFGCDEMDIPSDRISSDLRRISAREGKIAGWQWTPKQYRIWMHSCSPSSGRVWKNPMTLTRM